MREVVRKSSRPVGGSFGNRGLRAGAVVLFLALAAPLLALLQPSQVGAVPPSSTSTSTTLPPDPGVLGDTLRVYQSRQMRSSAISAAFAAAASVGASATLFDAGTIGLVRAWRDGTVVYAAPEGYRYPLSVSSLGFRAAIPLYGRAVARVLAYGDLVMSRASADYRGLRVGDVVDLFGWNRSIRKVRIGAISDHIPGELMVGATVAKRLGMRRPSFVLIHGISSRTALLDALRARSAAFGRARFVGSWMDEPADETLSLWQLKMALGEFAIRGTKDLDVDPAWSSTHLQVVHWRMGDKTVDKVCNRVIAAATEEAFNRINEAGLGAYLNAADTRRSGGCYHPRTVRSLGSSTGGNLSVHSWGGALDFNVSSNCLGCIPTMRCEIVQIFRELGFAWGGNFLTPDGMHFEWVGEPRHERATRPGDYCPVGGLLGPLAHDGVLGGDGAVTAYWDGVTRDD